MRARPAAGGGAEGPRCGGRWWRKSNPYPWLKEGKEVGQEKRFVPVSGYGKNYLKSPRGTVEKM